MGLMGLMGLMDLVGRGFGDDLVGGGTYSLEKREGRFLILARVSSLDLKGEVVGKQFVGLEEIRQQFAPVREFLERCCEFRGSVGVDLRLSSVLQVDEGVEDGAAHLRDRERSHGSSGVEVVVLGPAS